MTIDREWLTAKLDELDGLVGAEVIKTTADGDSLLSAWGVDADIHQFALDLASRQLVAIDQMLTPRGHVEALHKLGLHYLTLIVASSTVVGGFELGYLAALERPAEAVGPDDQDARDARLREILVEYGRRIDSLNMNEAMVNETLAAIKELLDG